MYFSHGEYDPLFLVIPKNCHQKSETPRGSGMNVPPPLLLCALVLTTCIYHSKLSKCWFPSTVLGQVTWKCPQKSLDLPQELEQTMPNWWFGCDQPPPSGVWAPGQRCLRSQDGIRISLVVTKGFSLHMVPTSSTNREPSPAGFCAHKQHVLGAHGQELPGHGRPRGEGGQLAHNAQCLGFHSGVMD